MAAFLLWPPAALELTPRILTHLYAHHTDTKGTSMADLHGIRILQSESRIPVQAAEASAGLYVYELPDTVNPGDPYRWRIGHHTGLAIATAISETNSLAGAAAIADLTDWTQGPDVSASLSGSELAKRLRRSKCYRAGY